MLKEENSETFFQRLKNFFIGEKIHIFFFKLTYVGVFFSVASFISLMFFTYLLIGAITDLKGLEIGRYLVVFILGLILGFIFSQARYGFSSHFRKFLLFNSFDGFLSELLLLGIASFLFGTVYILNYLFFPQYKLGAFSSPISLSLVLGAFIFGIGMQVADGCSSGVIYTAGKGSYYSVIAIFFFIVGTILAGYVLSIKDGIWNVEISKDISFLYILNMKRENVNLLDIVINFFIVFLQISFFFILFTFLGIVQIVLKTATEKKSNNEEKKSIQRKIFLFFFGWLKTEKNKEIENLNDFFVSLFVLIKKVWMGPWNVYFGAIFFAFIIFLIWIVGGKPLGVTGGQLFLGLRVLYLLGFRDYEHHSYFDGLDLGKIKFFETQQIVTNTAILLGACFGAILSLKFPVTYVNFFSNLLKNNKKMSVEKKKIEEDKPLLKEEEKEQEEEKKDVENEVSTNSFYQNEENKEKEEKLKEFEKKIEKTNSKWFFEPEIIAFKVVVKSFAHVIGGLLLGFGAILGGGCNIGAYVSSVCSFSFSPYVWIIFCLIGNVVGISLRKYCFLNVEGSSLLNFNKNK